MLIDGLKLALVGMSVVFAFLVLLVLIVHISTRLFKANTEKEAREMATPQRRMSSMGNGRLVAVISAAIASHRARAAHTGG
ncbi:MAG: hypothetical protein VR64_02995 [Desulfatitalea sp. BRH_c12]|nr:MAG: hypothetical protein VR64_02995 [Desulfatitalea sp. BRH_c12]